ncbi:MAG: sigma-E processing peptidase SpoIIGA [Clostridiales bacterium]|nr:sigma-E processing peptidase SpoIIGA [Clostridiales bacterium]
MPRGVLAFLSGGEAMQLEVYADVVFFINFAMDCLILWVAGKLSRSRARLWRLLLGSGLMALMYCAMVFVADLHIFYHMASAVLMLMIGVWVAYLPTKAIAFIKLIAMSYAASFFIGGIGTALFYSTQFNNILGSIADVTVNHFSLPILVIASVTFYAVFKIASVWLDSRALKRQLCLSVRIFFGERECEFNALVDTGNSLRDPLSHCPVIVAEFDSVKNFLPDSMKLIFYEKQENDLQHLLAGAEGSTFSGRLRMIPYESLGRKNGLLIGFRPDKVEIDNGKGVILLQDVVIGIYNFTLSSDGGYQGLLNPEMIA